MQLFDKNTMNAPWGLESRMKLALSAIKFFNPSKYPDICTALDKTPSKSPEPFSTFEFLSYLEAEKVFDKKPNAFRVLHILGRMSSVEILQSVGRKPGDSQLFNECYVFLNADLGERSKGFFWLARVLGNDFLFYLIAPGIVQITGKTDGGDEVAGTGIVFHPHHILTCRHVLCDMKVNQLQTFQGLECAVDENAFHTHEEDDVAVIRVDTPLQPVPGLVFQSPVIAQTVFTLGFPKIPYTREAALTMQPGAVTSEAVVSLSGENLFLYSAISRPGNSGGPVVSEDGYIVGISSKDFTVANSTDQTDTAFSPHYAGVSSHVIAKSVAEMGLGVQIPFENFE